MMVEIAKWVVILFGVYIILIGFLMLIKPKVARSTLRKAASTNFINYAEITIRLMIGIALIIYADFSKFPEGFNVFGWFLAITSLILYVVPRHMHHAFSMKSADILRPIYFQLVSPFAFLFGGLIIYYAI